MAQKQHKQSPPYPLPRFRKCYKMSRNETLVPLLQPKFSKYGRALQEGKDAIICGSSQVQAPSNWHLTLLISRERKKLNFWRERKVRRSNRMNVKLQLFACRGNASPSLNAQEISVSSLLMKLSFFCVGRLVLTQSWSIVRFQPEERQATSTPFAMARSCHAFNVFLHKRCATSCHIKRKVHKKRLS